METNICEEGLLDIVGVDIKPSESTNSGCLYKEVSTIAFTL